MRRETDNVADIVIAGRRIVRYIGGIERQQFEDDEMRQDAVVRQIGIIGEAVRRLSEEFRLAHPDIPWQDIIGMRNVVIHSYDRVDLGEIWRVATREMSALIESLEPLLPPPPDAP